MEVNFNVKIKTGKRTAIRVRCYSTSVNTKTMEFKDSERKITDAKVSDWIEKLIKEGLSKYASGL